MRNSLLIAFLALAISGSTVKTIPLRITVRWGNESVALDQPYTFDSSKVVISKLKFILTNLKTAPKIKPSAILFDLADTSSWSIHLPTKSTVDTLVGLFGVDSLSCVSGVKTGVLDPRNGMYWTWNSGYIFFKLEGTINGKAFTWHVGGFAGNQAAMFPIRIASKQGMYTLNLDLKKLMQLAKVSTSEIMLPGKEAVEFSKYLSQSLK